MSSFSKLAAGVNPDLHPDKPKPERRNVSFGEKLVKDSLLKSNEALKQEVIKLKQERLENKGLLHVAITDLHEIPGRKRTLDAEQYSQLLENLRHNDLVTPIVVRKREAGGYELISGHNRTQAFRELGRESIPAIISDIKDQDANKDAFFANLIHPALPDYEKFVGIQGFIKENPGFTLDNIAKQIGISKGHLAKILSFDRLPAAAHELLKANRGVLGAQMAIELAALAERGHSELVVAAIELIAKSELEQTKAKDWIQKTIASESKKPAQEVAKPISIKKGKAAFCNMRRAHKVIRLEFQSQEQAETLEKHIHEFLKTLAKAD